MTQSSAALDAWLYLGRAKYENPSDGLSYCRHEYAHWLGFGHQLHAKLRRTHLAARNTRQKDRYFEAAVEYQEQLTSPFRSATEAPRPPPPSRRRTLRTR